MNLNQLFDVVRGFNVDGSGPSIAESFTPATGTTVVPGNIVTIGPTGATLATTPDRSSAAPVPTWLAVMAGDFDSTFTGKFVAVRGNVMVKTDQFTASGSWAVGALASFSSGLFVYAASPNQIIGEVIEDNRTTGLADGTLTIMYTGGDARMF